MPHPGYLRNRLGIPAFVEAQYVTYWGDCVPNHGVYGVDYYTKHYTQEVEMDYGSMNPTPQALAARDAVLAYWIDQLCAYTDPESAPTAFDLEVLGDDYHPILIWDPMEGPIGRWVQGDPADVMDLVILQDISNVVLSNLGEGDMLIWDDTNFEWNNIDKWWVAKEQIDVSLAYSGETNRNNFNTNKGVYDDGYPVILSPGSYQMWATVSWDVFSDSCSVWGAEGRETELLMSGGSGEAMFYANDVDYVHFKNLNFSVTGSPPAVPFIKVVRGSFGGTVRILIENCYFGNNSSSDGAVFIDFAAGGFVQSAVVTVRNCWFTSNTLGIRIRMPGFSATEPLAVIENCMFEGNTTNLSAYSPSIYSRVMNFSNNTFKDGQFTIENDSSGISFLGNSFATGTGFSLGTTTKTFFDGNKFSHEPFTSGVLAAAFAAGHADRILWGNNYRTGGTLIPMILTEQYYATYIAEESGEIEILEIDASKGSNFYIDVNNVAGKPGGVEFLMLKINGGYYGQEIKIVNNTSQSAWASNPFRVVIYAYGITPIAYVQVKPGGAITLIRSRNATQTGYMPHLGSSQGMWNILGFSEGVSGGTVNYESL